MVDFGSECVNVDQNVPFFISVVYKNWCHKYRMWTDIIVRNFCIFWWPCTSLNILLCKNVWLLKANLHMTCHAHAVPLPCHVALIHTYPSMPLPFSIVLREGPRGSRKYPNRWYYSLTDWYASDNNLRGIPRGSRKKPNVGRLPTCRLWTPDANSHMPCHAPIPCHAVSWSWEVTFRTAWSWHDTGMAWHVWIKHGHAV
jgi:hypothetical protein